MAVLPPTIFMTPNLSCFFFYSRLNLTAYNHLQHKAKLLHFFSIIFSQTSVWSAVCDGRNRGTHLMWRRRNCNCIPFKFDTVHCMTFLCVILSFVYSALRTVNNLPSTQFAISLSLWTTWVRSRQLRCSVDAKILFGHPLQSETSFALIMESERS